MKRKTTCLHPYHRIEERQTTAWRAPVPRLKTETRSWLRDRRQRKDRERGMWMYLEWGPGETSWERYTGMDDVSTERRDGPL